MLQTPNVQPPSPLGPGLMEKVSRTCPSDRAAPIKVLGYRWDADAPASAGETEPDLAWLVVLHLRACPRWSLRVDGIEIPTSSIGEGDFTVHDLRRRQLALFDRPVNALCFYIPRSALKTVAERLDRDEDLPHLPGQTYSDPQVTELSRFLRPAAARASGAPHPFVDSLAQAICARIIDKTGARDRPRQRCGLAPWQEHRAKAMLENDDRAGVTIEDVARACRLSVSHFTRCFRQSTGMTPRIWRANLRIARAKALLQDPAYTLAQISVDCGFSDQSHFTRTFGEFVGMTPGRWRRLGAGGQAA